jgi:hypothetical protein
MSFKFPRVNITARSKFFHTGICLWKPSLLLEIKKIKSKNSFKKQAKVSIWTRLSKKGKPHHCPLCPLQLVRCFYLKDQYDVQLIDY